MAYTPSSRHTAQHVVIQSGMWAGAPKAEKAHGNQACSRAEGTEAGWSGGGANWGPGQVAGRACIYICACIGGNKQWFKLASRSGTRLSNRK